jgi:hypothetical protein
VLGLLKVQQYCACVILQSNMFKFLIEFIYSYKKDQCQMLIFFIFLFYLFSFHFINYLWWFCSALCLLIIIRNNASHCKFSNF